MAGLIRNGNQGNRDPLPALPARGRENEWQGNRDHFPALPARGRENEWQGSRDPLPALPARGRENEWQGNRDPLPALPARGRETESRVHRDPLPALPARGRENGWRPLLLGALAMTLAACGSGQPAGTVTFQVISDTGPLAHGDAIFAATSLGGVEAEGTASPLNQTLEGYQWKVRMIPPKSAYIALIIGPQSKGAAVGLSLVRTH